MNAFQCPRGPAGFECRPDERFRCRWCERVIVGRYDVSDVEQVWREKLLDALHVRAMLLASDFWWRLAIERAAGPPQWLRDVVAMGGDSSEHMHLFRDQAEEYLRKALFCEARALEAGRRCGWW